jgi:hypothetical protein
MCGRMDIWSRLSGILVVDTSKLEAAGWRPAVDTYAGFLAMVRAQEGKS